MGLIKETQNNTQNLLTVLADGKFHLKVEEGTEGSTTREVEVDVIDEKGKKTGTEVKVVHEIVYSSIADEKITNMYFAKGKFGENLIIDIENVGSVSLNTANTYAEQVLRKLPNVDLSKPVTLTPYNYQKNGKTMKGMTIIQDGEKLQDYYFDYDKKVGQNGLPEFDGDKDDSNDWKMYFMVVNKFLKKQVQPIFESNNFKAPEVNEDVPTTTKVDDSGEDDDFVNKF